MKKKVLSFIFSILLLACSLGISALAAENPTAELSVDISVSGTAPATPEEYAIELKAADPANPMPEGSDSGVYTLLAKGKGTFGFPVITYTRVGVYRYTVRQVPGTTPLCTYDDTVYNVCVTVINDNAGGLEAYVTVRMNDGGDKPDNISFKVSYKTDDPDQPQTGDTSDIELWSILMVVSLLGLLAVAFVKKKDVA